MIMEVKIKNIPIKQLELNEGQIDGLPKNPRFIKDDRFRALIKSLQDAPEMLNLRELIVVEHDNSYVVIGGNMRLRASIELGITELPCKILPKDTPVEKLREYTIKDNNGFGENDWDLLANEWDEIELEEWGTELPTDWDDADKEHLETGIEVENGLQQHKIKIGGIVIILSDEEYVRLYEKAKEYCETYQNTYGFITYILDGDN
jgi:hypothetical protein